MARTYNSFLVRCWQLNGHERRIRIEHVQTGARVRVSSVVEAIEWISARSGGVEPLAETDEANPAHSRVPHGSNGGKEDEYGKTTS